MHKPTKPLESLPALSRSELLALWAEVFGTPLSFRAQKDFLICALAHRMQEQAQGGLKPSTRKRLQKLSEELEGGIKTAPTEAVKLKPGARLIREWRGETHEVNVVSSGFEYRKKSYKSLSEIARLITGTRWSGPRFFGLVSLQPKAPERRHGG